MKTRNALFTWSLLLAMSLSTFASPVSPVREITPFPDEVSKAITSVDGIYLNGAATITFHINDANRVVIEDVDSSIKELKDHVWYTVHGMETADTTLTPGQTYTLTVRVKQ